MAALPVIKDLDVVENGVVVATADRAKRRRQRDERILLVNARGVNWTPWWAWTIPPSGGCRFLIAMPSALTTRVESWALSIDQPTIFLEKVSMTAQQ